MAVRLSAVSFFTFHISLALDRLEFLNRLAEPTRRRTTNNGTFL